MSPPGTGRSASVRSPGEQKRGGHDAWLWAPDSFRWTALEVERSRSLGTEEAARLCFLVAGLSWKSIACSQGLRFSVEHSDTTLVVSDNRVALHWGP